MQSPGIRLGVAVSINAVAMLFLAHALLSEADDFYLNASRAYVALIMMAPVVITLLLVAPALSGGGAVDYVVLGVFAVLLLAALALAPAETMLAESSMATEAPATGVLARY